MKKNHLLHRCDIKIEIKEILYTKENIICFQSLYNILKL